MKLANLTIKQMGSICRRNNKNLFTCDEKCPFFMSDTACFLARGCLSVMNDKISDKEIDPSFIKQEIDEDFYMNRFMEVS